MAPVRLLPPPRERLLLLPQLRRLAILPDGELLQLALGVLQRLAGWARPWLGVTEVRVPSLILQPLIENAVKYGVAPSKRPVAVTIEATSDRGSLILIVEDDGRQGGEARPQSGETGVGLANIAARLETLYGTAGRIEVVRREAGFTAVIRLPLSRQG